MEDRLSTMLNSLKESQKQLHSLFPEIKQIPANIEVS